MLMSDDYQVSKMDLLTGRLKKKTHHLKKIKKEGERFFSEEKCPPE